MNLIQNPPYATPTTLAEAQDVVAATKWRWEYVAAVCDHPREAQIERVRFVNALANLKQFQDVANGNTTVTV